MSQDHDFPEDVDADVFGNDVFGNDVLDISVWEDGGDRSLVEKVVNDAIKVASSLHIKPPPPRATPALPPPPVRPPRTPTGWQRKVLLEKEGAAACFSWPMRRPQYEQKSPPAAQKMEQQLPMAPTVTPRTRKKQHLVLTPALAKRKSATGTKSSDSSVVAFPVDWGNFSGLAQDEVIKSPNPQPQHARRRYSESGATFTPSFPSLDNAPEPISYSGIRRHSLACSSDWENDHFSTLLTTIANKNPSDESSLFSDMSDPSKCSQGSRSPRGSRRRSPASPSVEASHRRSSNQANGAYRRPSSRGNSCTGGEQEWSSSTDSTEAWPVDQSVSSSTESTATDSSRTSAVVRQKRVANRRLSNSSFGENSKGSQHSGSNAGAEWSRQRRPTSAMEVDGLKKEFQVRRSSTSNSTEGRRHRRASSLSRNTARRSSTGNSTGRQQGWPTTDFAEDDSQADHSRQDDSKYGHPGIQAGRENIKKYEKASRKDAADGEDSKSRQTSKSKTSRSNSRSRPPKPASKDQIEEKRDEHVGRSERKLRRSSLRGDQGSSSCRDEGENAETGAGPSDTTERDHAAMVFPSVTPRGRKPMLSMKLGRRDDKEGGVALDLSV